MNAGSPHNPHSPPGPASDKLSLPGGVREIGEMSAAELIAALQGLRGSALGAGDSAALGELAAGVKRLTRAQASWLLAEGRVLAQASARALDAEPWQGDVPELLQRAAAQGFATMPARSAAGQPLWIAAVRQPRLNEGWMLLALADTERAHLNELLLRAQLVADLPGSVAGRAPAASGGSHASAASGGSATSVAATPEPLDDIGLQLARQTRFGAAAIALVNTLAQASGAEQVLLAWRSATGGLATVAISHRERFDRFAHPVVLSEDALEESLLHDNGVLLPAGTAPEHSGAVPAHALLQAELGARHLLTLPLAREGHAADAALLLVWDASARAAPEPTQVAAFKRTLATSLPWLHTLHERDRPWPARLLAGLRASLARWLGPGRLGLKTSAITLAALLLFSIFASWDYRISAGAQLATDSTRVLGAMFDGRVEDARASAGQAVAEGELLARLDTRELRQQDSDAAAELRRYTAEADKARAGGQLADLEVASARAAQAEARLARVREQIAQAEARAPFAGIVVEGEQKDLQGAPVRKGDKLYRIARVEGLYATLQVGERDAARVRSGASGELALLARPDERIPLRVVAVVPVAQTKGTEGNHFLVRAELAAPAADWWRPGLSGTARIDAGEERVIWVLTHRIVDTLRLWLWI
jgi:hypothetical protein